MDEVSICAREGCGESFQKKTHNQKFHDPQCKRDAENAARRRQYTLDVANAVAPAYMEDDENLVEFLRKENARLARAADKYKMVRDEQVVAVYDAVEKAIGQIEIPTVNPPQPDRRRGDEEVAVAVLADWQLGKALADHTPVLTTMGWKTHGELQVGDYVYGPEGKPVAITAVTGSSVQECYEVVFDDDSSIIASGDHLWSGYRKYKSWPENKYSRRPLTWSTSRIAEEYNDRGFQVDVTQPLVFESNLDLPIDPYVLGLYLGDGHMPVNAQDVDYLERFGIAQDRSDKVIPQEYLHADQGQRLALVQGLMDANGNIEPKSGVCTFDNTNKNIVDGLIFLLESLGIKTRIDKLNGAENKLCYRVNFRPDRILNPVFRLERKLAKLHSIHSDSHTNYKFIQSVRPCGSFSAQCITVDGDMYLAGEKLVPTHNCTPTYNSEVCRERILKYAEKVIRITNIQRADHPVRNLRVWILGDIVEGEDIFSGQSHLLDSSLYRQVGVNGPEILGSFLTRMLEEFETIHVTAVIGNHGCHTTDTRALTDNGLKYLDEIDPERDRVLSVDDEGNSVWVCINDVIDYSYTGNLYQVNNRNISFNVTENHRIVGLHESKNNWIVNTPDALPWMQNIYSSGRNTNSEYDIDDSAISRAAHVLNNDSFVSESTSDNDILPDWLWKLSSRQVDVFVRELATNDMTIMCDNSNLRESLQAFLVSSGYKVSAAEHSEGHWKLNIGQSQFSGLKSSEVQKQFVENERVWCLSVPFGRFFVERDGKIHLSGNSIGGRNRKEYNSETNMDRLLYKIVELMFRNEPRITFNIPDGNGESNFYAVDTIGEYGTLLMHGDQFPPPSSSHSYYKKVMGWKDGAIEEKFSDVFCFTKDSMVLTRKGYISIAEIKVGDEVLTHLGNWKSVTAIQKNKASVVKLKGHGHPGLTTTLEHPFWVSRLYRDNDITWSSFSDPEWKEAQKLEKDDFWISPCNFPQANIPELIYEDVREFRIEMTPALMKVIGRWVGDGHKGHNGLTIVANLNEVPQVENEFKAAGLPYKGFETGNKNVKSFNVNSKAIRNWVLEHFGEDSYGKTIPSWLLGTPLEFRQAFLEGYLSADGPYPINELGREWEACTVSKSLALGIKMLAQSLGFFTYLYLDEQGSKEERFPSGTYPIKDRWIIKGRLSTAGHQRAVNVDNNYHLYPYKSQEDIKGEQNVYNMTVEDDSSYIVDGLVVHNCGHYHQNVKMTLGASILRISGSPESHNTFAQEVLAVMGRPSQHLQFVHPHQGVTSEHTIYLDN